MPRPNLFIIGAMKSGTTSLHRYLAAHPQVFMCEPKEPGYFVKELNWKRGPDWYSRLFEPAGDAKVIGESSTHYTKLPSYQGVARRIHDFNPAARLVYVMRDPLDRAISHYWHNVRDLREEAERRDMPAAVRRDPRYIAYSDYAMQLEPYLDLFGRGQITLLTFEELTADPAATVGRLCGWLGLENSVPRETFSARWNVRPAELKGASGWGGLNQIRNTAWWAAVRPLVPHALRRIGTRLAEKDISVEAAGIGEAAEYLRPILFERVQALSRLVQRDFPEWTYVSGAGGDTLPATAGRDG